MPIDVKELFKEKKVNNKDVKYFDKSFTGNGKSKIGLFNNEQNFLNKNTLDGVYFNDIVKKKDNLTIKDFIVQYYPIDPIKTYYYLANNQIFKTKTDEDDFKLYETKEVTYYLRTKLSDLCTLIPKENAKAKDKQIGTRYNCEIIEVDNFKTEYSFCIASFQADNHKILRNSIVNIINNVKYVHQIDKTLLNQNIDTYLENQNFHHDLANMAEIYKTKLVGYITNQIDEKDLLKDLDIPITTQVQRHRIIILSHMLTVLSNWQLETDDYLQIYNFIKDKISDEVIKRLAMSNSIFMVFDEIWSLKKDKHNLHNLKKYNLEIPEGTIVSDEQKAAILADEPLILVQAGAGTGKTYTITNRLDTMIKSGVDPKKILPISFTRTGAQNLQERYPDVRSITLSSYMNEIYLKNYPSHQLTDTTTLVNMLPVKCKMNNAAAGLKSILTETNNPYGENKATIFKLASFISENRKEVEKLLNTLKLTTLTIQTIFCYLFIDQDLEVPGEIPEHLIIDEVQDNSIFDNIFALKYTSRFKNSLYFVGDASQTLFEFRASDPNLLNTIETSDLFTCYQLTTNFRSNAEILDVVNPLLQNVGANKNAGIQLKTNDVPIIIRDKQMVEAHVKIKHFELAKPKQMLDEMIDYEKSYYEDFYKDKDFLELIHHILNSGEQLLLLSHTRRGAYQLGNLIKHVTKQINGKESEVRSLITAKNVANHLISNFINTKMEKYLTTIKPENLINDIIFYLKNGINDYIIYQMRSRNTKRDTDYMNLYVDNLAKDLNVKMPNFINQFKNGSISKQTLYDVLTDFLLDFEIKQNNIKSLLYNSNDKEKLITPEVNFYISTIHGAKGLEFDNVFYMINLDNLHNEETKRETYVALTRAKKFEYLYTASKHPTNPFGEILESMITI